MGSLASGVPSPPFLELLATSCPTPTHPLAMFRRHFEHPEKGEFLSCPVTLYVSPWSNSGIHGFLDWASPAHYRSGSIGSFWMVLGWKSNIGERLMFETLCSPTTSKGNIHHIHHASPQTVMSHATANLSPASWYTVALFCLVVWLVKGKWLIALWLSIR